MSKPVNMTIFIADDTTGRLFVLMASFATIQFLGLLTIAFTVMRHLGIILWPWWKVTAPLWGPPAVIAGTVALWMIATGIQSGMKWKAKEGE